MTSSIMKTILVTGGAGYVGSHTVKELVKQGYDVIVLDSLEAGHKEAVDPKAKLEVVNLKEKDKISEVFDKYKIDAVIDFAAYLAVGESMEEPKKYLQNNVYNFINLLEVMEEKGCKHIIKSSTAATYGNPTKDSDIPWDEKFTEEYKPEKSALLEGKIDGKKLVGEDFFQKIIGNYDKKVADENLKLEDKDLTKLRIPLSVYGLTKLLDEIILRKYNELHNLSSIALRYFNVSGADPESVMGEDKPKPTTLMTVCFWQILDKIPEVQIFGRDYETPDGTGIRDYIHPSDLGVGHVKALEYLFKTNSSDIFNLGTGEGSSVLEVIAAVEKASGKKVNTKDAPRRSGDATTSVADPTKANQKLDWHTKYDIDDMAQTAWRWHSKNPEGFGS